VLVLEDVHWAVPALLDLVEYLLGWLRGPVLILCVARPDLVELRAGWLNPRANVDALVLEPLGADEAESLLDGLQADRPARARIAEAAEGNPLFLEQMAAMLAEQPAEAEPTIPPSIHALLAARLDQLEPVERALIDRAAVVGRDFSRTALTALCPPELEGSLPGALMGLVRKELLVPDASGSGPDDVFRFGHILIREAAYEAVPKQVRAQLHEQLANWYGSAPEETVGFHLEQAYLAGSELGRADARLRALGSRAGRLLDVAGRRALGREDLPAAISLLERAAALLEDEPEQRSAVLIELGLALRGAGRIEAADRAFATAEEAPSEHLRRRALLERSALRAFVDPSVAADDLLRVANEAIDVFAANEDDAGLASAWVHVAEVHWLRCHCADVEDAVARGLVHAEGAGERAGISSLLSLLAPAALVGPRPVDDAIGICRGILERREVSAGVDASVRLVMSVLEAMHARLDDARRLYGHATATLEDLGLTSMLASLRMYSGMTELIARDHEAAEREFRRGYDELAALGHSAYLSTTAAFLAKPLYELGRYDDAFEVTQASAEAASRDDIASQSIWRSTRAKILARRGDDAAAELAQEALDLLEDTDLVNTRADALVDLGETMRLLGRKGEASRARAGALELYEAKGNLASAAAMRQT
jgi:predicted ATPase